MFGCVHIDRHTLGKTMSMICSTFRPFADHRTGCDAMSSGLSAIRTTNLLP